MPKLTALPRPIGATVLSLLLLAAALAPVAEAAPTEGSGSLTVSPNPIVLPATTVGNQTSPQTVTLGYEGEGEAWVNKVTIEGEESGEFFFNGSNCNNLSEGQHCEAWIGLKPGTTGAKHALLVITFMGERSPVSFEISGDSVVPQLAIIPGEYDFGLHRANRESVSNNFQIENSGDAPLQISNWGISGPGSGAFSTGNSNCNNWLAPGERCSVDVWFNPQDQAAYEAQLRVWASGEAFSANLSGQGGRPLVETPENPVGFGVATVGGPGAVRAITLTNSGDMAESFFIGVVAGGNAASFRLLDENCTAAPLAPATTCTAHVRFAPDSAGAKSARLAFFGDGDGMMIQLDGEGVAPALALAPGNFYFGSQAKGSKSAGRSFGVRNDGTTAVTIGTAAIVGSNLDQFLLAGDECTGVTLGPGQECLVRIRFAPETVGAKTATLRVSSDAGALTASLSGTGVAPEKSGGAGDSSAAGQNSRFRRGATLSAAKARCLAPGRCGKARAAKHARSHPRAAR